MVVTWAPILTSQGEVKGSRLRSEPNTPKAQNLGDLPLQPAGTNERRNLLCSPGQEEPPVLFAYSGGRFQWSTTCPGKFIWQGQMNTGICFVCLGKRASISVCVLWSWLSVVFNLSWQGKILYQACIGVGILLSDFSGPASVCCCIARAESISISILCMSAWNAECESTHSLAHRRVPESSWSAPAI